MLVSKKVLQNGEGSMINLVELYARYGKLDWEGLLQHCYPCSNA